MDVIALLENYGYISITKEPTNQLTGNQTWLMGKSPIYRWTLKPVNHQKLKSFPGHV